MIDVPNTIKSVICNEYTVKNHRIEFLDMDKADLTNNNLVYDSFSFTESVCSQDQFAFGLSEASSVQFETVDIDDDHKVGNILDQRIRVSLEYKLTASQAAEVAGDPNLHERSDIGGYWYTIPIGVFYVESCPRNHENMAHRQVTAYSRNERNFKIEFAGAYKKSKVSIPVDALVNAATIEFNENEVLEKTTYSSGQEEYTRRGSFDMKTGWANNQYGFTYQLWSSPVGSYVTKMSANRTRFSPDEIVFLKSVYKKHEADSTIGPQMYATCLSKMPSNSYVYEPNLAAETLTGYKKAYTSAAQSVALHSCNFQPMVNIIATINTGNTIHHCFCYPIFLQPGKTIVIDPANLTLPSDTWKKADISYYDLQVIIPVVWFGKDDVGSLQWYKLNNKTGGSDDSPDFSGDWSFDTTYTRDDYTNIKTYYRKVSKSEYTGMKIAFESTLEFSKTSLGKYHTYSNAVGTDDVLNGTAEINASFMKTTRTGSVELKALNNENPVDLDDSATVDSAWWDEYDVYPIGKIHYKYQNENDEEVTANYSFNSEGKSVYDMSDNWLLSNLSTPRTLSANTKAAFGEDKGALYKWTGSIEFENQPFGGYSTSPRIMESVDSDDYVLWRVYPNHTYGYVKTVTAYYADTPSSKPVEYTYDVWCDLGQGSITNNAYIKYLLRSKFIPKLQYASFTPLEMSISNMPYLEAGDAIRFTAKDGETVVNSYVLKQTISGSQKIVSQIECVDGQILSREEDYEDE